MEEITTEVEGMVLTPSAIKEVKGIIERKNLGDVALRVGVEGGGCSGLSYKIHFDAERTASDTTMEMDGLRVVMDEKSAVYLAGVTLDYSYDLTGGGFKFTNPNAKSRCGCGESFSA